MKHLTFKLTT